MKTWSFWVVCFSFVALIAAFVMHFLTFSALHYQTDRWVIALSIIALWSEAMLLFEKISGKKFFAFDIFLPVAVIAATLALFKFLIPCLSPIGIYFTVHNMGDVEANAIGVPRSIACIVLYVLSIIAIVPPSFESRLKENGAV